MSGTLDACSGITDTEIREALGCGSASLPSKVTDIINVVISVLGMVAVICIIVGAVNYMTSAGDPGKVKKAKDMILYSIIGLVVAILAYAIVNFVLKGVFG